MSRLSATTYNWYHNTKYKHCRFYHTFLSHSVAYIKGNERNEVQSVQ